MESSIDRTIQESDFDEKMKVENEHQECMEASVGAVQVRLDEALSKQFQLETELLECRKENAMLKSLIDNEKDKSLVVEANFRKFLLEFQQVGIRAASTLQIMFKINFKHMMH